MQSIELKFGMRITGHRLTNPIDFGECRLFTGVKKILYITAYGVNSLKGSTIQTVHSIELKFGMYIIGLPSNESY